MADLYLALLHHPVLDKNGQIVTTAVTNMDIHDIARSARTYGVRALLRRHAGAGPAGPVARRSSSTGRPGYGSTYNADPQGGPGLVAIEPDLDGALVAVERETGQRPRSWSTSARAGGPTAIRFDALRARLAAAPSPYLLVFGTGWGLAPEVTGAGRPAPRAGARADATTTTSRCAPPRPSFLTGCAGHGKVTRFAGIPARQTR